LKIYKLFLLFILVFSVRYSPTIAQTYEYKFKTNILYYPEDIAQEDLYIKERCVLDLYSPINKKNFPTIVWFHGGGLTGGEKEIPRELKEKGFAIVGVNYRLSPKVKSPKYVEDAAAAVAWVFNNIANYGGDTV
jgi:acetyl esterase/lipase